MLKVIQILPIDKSLGVYNLSTRLLRDNFLAMIVVITYLINKCLRLSVMPVQWKMGTITLLPKGSLKKTR